MGDPQEPPDDHDAPDTCAQCGGDLYWEDCEACGGTGQTESGELHSLDPFWWDEEDTDDCPTCDGAGSWPVCPTCIAESRRKEAAHA